MIEKIILIIDITFNGRVCVQKRYIIFRLGSYYFRHVYFHSEIMLIN